MKYARDLAPREDTLSIALAHDSPASASRTRGPSGNLLALQRAVGNRAVGRLIQAKLRIGQPNDRYEQEADQVAGQVMHMPDPTLELNHT
jgi:hypothetical protein